MALYVFGLVDEVPSGRAGKGLTGALSIRKISGAQVVVERRADVPPIEFGSLKKHQDVVSRLARQVPAILPVRFGTLLDAAHLEEALLERDDEIAAAFDLVRGRVQFTWRIKRGAGIGVRGTGNGERGSVAGTKAKAGGPFKSGTAYLRQAAHDAHPAPPAVFRPLRATLAPLLAGQRYQPPAPGVTEAVYHLVDRNLADRYAAAAAEVTASSPALTMSGPFPPFAFAPEIL